MKKLLLVFGIIFLLIISSSAQESKNQKIKKGHNAIELSGGYGMFVFANQEMLDHYNGAHGLRLNGMIRFIPQVSIGVYYAESAFITGGVEPYPEGLEMTSLAAELRLKLLKGTWIYGRFGKTELKNFPDIEEKVSSAFLDLGLRFETNKEKTISIFIDGGYSLFKFEDIECSMNHINLSVGLCINF